MNGIAIVSGALTPQARQGGVLRNATCLELAGAVASAAVRRSGIPPHEFGHVFWGLMYQCEGNSTYLARHAALAAGLPTAVPAALTNRLCGSGLEAMVQAARCLALHEAHAVLIGGTDTVSRAASIRLTSAETPQNGDHSDPLHRSLHDDSCGFSMAELAESFAVRHGIARTDLDHFAVTTRSRARRAMRRGVLRPFLLPVSLPQNGNCESPPTLSDDQIEGRWNRKDAVMEQPSLFGAAGRITRANTSAFADGAGALVLASTETAGIWRCTELCRIQAWSIVAVDPIEMGAALASAIESVLARAAVAADQVDWYELEEAFPGYCLHAMRVLQLRSSKVNPWGGALAVGHAPATSGIRLLLSTASALQTFGLRFGVVAVCIGGGQGMAVLLENPRCLD